MERNEWEKHIEACSKSGISQKEYCIENHLNFSTFKYWRSRLKKGKTNCPKIIEVPVKPVNNNSPEINIMLLNGIKISVSCDINPEIIKPYVSLLREF